MWHYNGPSKEALVNETKKWPTFLSEAKPPVVEVADGILMTPIFAEKDAADFAEYLNEYPQWGPAKGDAVPGDELRLHLLFPETFNTKYAKIDKFFQEIINARWNPTTWSTVKDLFAIRYMMERQKEIRLHTDISRFSVSIVLERATRGGTLWFPRQNFTDDLVRPGVALVFPAPITHPHQVTPVEEGRRTSLVIWTER